ncbi:MAG: hypothetical protein HY369_02945 [Candidatus Aenigmarchaeota archaeon]|nr:hypothetical protein [Candidatus Aenigmarchaeota archaeon]
MKGEQQKQARLLASLIQRQIDEKVSSLEAKLDALARPAADGRIEQLERAVNDLKEALEDLNLASLEQDLVRQLQELENRVATIERRPAPSGAAPAQDLEPLRVKLQWLEMQIDKMDSRSLAEKVDELERKIDRLKVAAPYVIE